MSVPSTAAGHRRYADTEAVAVYTGLSKAFFEKARVTGIPKIPFIKIGRAVRYDLDAIDQFMADRSRLTTSESQGKAA